MCAPIHGTHQHEKINKLNSTRRFFLHRVCYSHSRTILVSARPKLLLAQSCFAHCPRQIVLLLLYKLVVYSILPSYIETHRLFYLHTLTTRLFAPLLTASCHSTLDITCCSSSPFNSPSSSIFRLDFANKSREWEE